MKKVKIIAIPFSGGNQYCYRPLNQFLPLNFELKTVEFPGRGERLIEKNICDITMLAMDALEQIKKDIQTNEYIIYGHSMGTLVGYELVKEIQKRKYQLPSSLFFTGRAGPSIKDDDQISSYSKDTFWQEISKLGGLPDEILSNYELRDFFEPVLRSDFKAVESYHYDPMIEPFKIPIHVIAGLDEDITPEELESWQRETILPLNKEFLPGNHFFIFDHTAKIIQQIANAYYGLDKYSKSASPPSPHVDQPKFGQN